MLGGKNFDLDPKDGVKSDKIFDLTCEGNTVEDCKWIELQQKLAQPKHFEKPILIPIIEK